jgi:energy-coupling factor transporter ATP-binding protein EcfA2
VPAASIHIEALDVWRREETSEPRLVIQQLSLDVAAGECVVLAGPNGAGKTSLLLALVGAAPVRGVIEIGGRRLDRASLDALRREIGFVFADPRDQLICASVGEEVAFGPRLRGASAAEVGERARAALEAVGLGGYEQRSPAALSLGEQRRVALASIFSYDAGVLLVDEPTASLDPVARTTMLRALRARQVTCVLATHDLDAALDLGARVVLLREGRIVADGPAERLLHDESLLAAAGLALPIAVAARRG